MKSVKFNLNLKRYCELFIEQIALWSGFSFIELDFESTDSSLISATW